MAKKSTIRLLLSNESANESERLISLFRNAGRVARAQRADSLEELKTLLKDQSWDLLIADEKNAELSIAQVLEATAPLDHFLPVIALSSADPVELLEAGAHDVLSPEDDRRLVLTAFRALQHQNDYRELQDVKTKLADAEERSALLMAESQDAIAYVADGMLINCNALFATRFGHSDPDDLDCAPVIDLIADADQDNFKGLLKTQLSQGEGSTHFSFSGINAEGESFDADMQISNAVYDEEPCVQLTIRDQGSSSSGGGSANSDKDYLTDLYNPSYLLTQLDAAAKQAAAGTGHSALLFIRASDYAALCQKFALSQAEAYCQELANALSASCEGRVSLTRYGGGSFAALLANSNAEAAQAAAEPIRQALQAVSTQVEQGDLSSSIHIGISLIDGQQSADATLNQAYKALTQAAEADSGIAVYVPPKEKKALGDAGNDAELDKILEDALEDEQCFLVFQPVVSLRGASGDHYEVQTHMMDADDREIDADEFLNSLHFSGINTRLDRWIILEATKQLAGQIDAGNDTRLFINLTANTLRDSSLISWLGVALKAGGIPAEAIFFQFQVADIKKYPEEAQAFSKAIKGLGCRVSVADFGMQEGSAEALATLQPNVAKIASDHTQKMLSGGDTEALKALVATLGEKEVLSIISGVENAAALAQLWQLGVDFIQGEYLAGPSRQMDYEFTDIA